MKIIVQLCVLTTLVTLAQDLSEIEDTTGELCGNGTEDSCEAFNTTEPPTSSSPATTATSTKTKSSTLKPVTKKPPPPSNSSTPPRPHPDCTCDFTNGGCEINCCCDIDCRPEQLAVFPHCSSAPPAVDPDHCFSQHILYRNNSAHQAVLTEPGVLCVVQQNTFASTDFIDVPVVKTVTALQKKLGKRKYYSWPNPIPSFMTFNVEQQYGSGSPIWISDNSSIVPLALPASVGSSSGCHSLMIPQYLEETVTSCSRPLKSKLDCLSSKENHFTIISSPRNFNFTHPRECTEDVCIPLQQYSCFNSCVEGKPPNVTFNDSNNICQHLIESVEYKIYHNGTQGIVQAKVFYTLKNLTVHQDYVYRKNYKVHYTWTGSSDQPVLRRSGRPGYEVGKPVISGRRGVKTVKLNVSAADWISVGTADSSGLCLNRYNLLFGENLRTQCLLAVSGSCKQIQKQIWEQLLGSAANLSEVVISSYGDPRVEEEEAWVPLLHPDLPPPPDLTTAVNIIIVYSLVGPVAAPQAKIIAAYLQPVLPGSTCLTDHTTLLIETSVKFIDKTTPAVTQFAQPPVYEIKLPQDFFYPFLSGGVSSVVKLEMIWLSVLLAVLI